MVSPNLVKRGGDDQPVEINEAVKGLFQLIYQEQNKTERSDDNIPRLRVSSLISRLSFFYEKIRNAVDYEEDHLLRKNAISRILRRQIMIEGVLKDTDALGVSNHLLIELIRGGYLPNNEIPEEKVGEIAGHLEKYLRLKDYFSSALNGEIGLKADVEKVKDLIKSKNKIIRWLLTLAACEIEENLSPDPIKKKIVTELFSVLTKIVKLPTHSPYEADLKIQIYLSISRTFLKSDSDMLNFVLFKYFNDSWTDFKAGAEIDGANLQKIEKLSGTLVSLKSSIDEQLNHPLVKHLDRITRRYSLYFTALSEAITDDPAAVYNEINKGEKSLANLIRKICNRKYKKAKKRLWRAAAHSIVYIFLTKSIFVFLIEIPAIKWFGEPLNLLSLAINISFPAILLFLIVMFTNRPGENNTDKIIEGVKEIALAGRSKKQPLVLRPSLGRNWFKNGIFNLIYAASFCVSIYFIIRILIWIDFNWVSIVIFLFFLAFVSFFSVITTKGVKELIVVERRENIFTFILDLFYMPIILVGRWLSGEVAKINVFIFLFDFIIETPFKVLVEVGEDWTRYVRERRDNLD
jgi:hypothetical protein